MAAGGNRGGIEPEAVLDRHHAPIGILLANLGARTRRETAALAALLGRCSDGTLGWWRPRLPWWLVLHGIILLHPGHGSPQRPPPRKLWTEGGSRSCSAVTRRQAEAVRRHIAERTGRPIPVAVGTRYGTASIEAAVAEQFWSAPQPEDRGAPAVSGDRPPPPPPPTTLLGRRWPAVGRCRTYG
ncbi:MAG: hypothetical protein U5L11_10405 [Arhodomonas sp.]|nr:hypothetical protein [Arhodomonas sp.]